MASTRSITVSFFAITALSAQSPAPDIRVPVRLVSAPTLVFSHEGQLVNGLDAFHFRLYDNGHPQNIALHTASMPVSIAIAIQAHDDVRDSLAFIDKAGSVLESLLLGESGDAAIIAYAGETTVVKQFSEGDMSRAMRSLPFSHSGPVRTLDAGFRALRLLEQQPASRSRILLFIGQSRDSGSESTLDSLREAAERDNVTVFAIVLPEIGKAFLSDNFSLESLSSRTDRGGFKASMNLGSVLSTLGRSGKAATGADPFSTLTAATGGTLLHVRRQREFEDAIALVGLQLRSSYLLSYSPDPAAKGYHAIRVEVDIPGAHAHTRPGYWLSEN